MGATEPGQGEEVRGSAATVDLAALKASARAAWQPFWASRLAVFGVAIWVTITGISAGEPPESEVVAHPFTAWPAGELLDLVFATLAKWDAQHYLAIALDGYKEGREGLPRDDQRPAFFPLFPGSVHVLSGFGASSGMVLIMAYVVSLSCFFGALALIHRLATIELGERYAKPALMLLAFFPTAFFFGIPYTEAMFLLLAAGAFLAARTGHWATAGVALALASATRVPGLLLIVPIAMLFLYGPRADRDPAPGRGRRPRYPLGPEAAWLLLAPVGLLVFSAYLQVALGDPLAWQAAQADFGRHTIDPVSGLWAALREAGASVANVVDGTWKEPPVKDYLNISQLAFLALAAAGGIGALRLLPAAYGTWVLLSLLPILVSQPNDNPLWSAPRFIAVLFPIFFWLAVVCERRGVTTAIVALFATGMATFVATFALWSFVA